MHPVNESTQIYFMHTQCKVEGPASFHMELITGVENAVDEKCDFKHLTGTQIHPPLWESKLLQISKRKVFNIDEI